jgi:adenylosuccinate synthase
VPLVLRPRRLSIFDHRLGKRRRVSGSTRKASISEDSVDNFEFIGECYIYGLMDGEAKDIYGQNPDSRTQTYKLIR